MSKQEFLYHLETLLMDLPREEREDALDYYEQYFEAAGPEREAEVIRELGSPERVSEMIHSGGSQDSAGRRVYERPVPPPRKSRAPLWIALGVIGVGFVLLLAVGFLSFAEFRTENTVRYSTGNSGYQGTLNDRIDGFVDGVMNDVMDQIGNSLENGLSDGIGAALNDRVFDEIRQQMEQEFGNLTSGTEGWDGMQDDYVEGDIPVQPEGDVVLGKKTPLAWKGVAGISINLPSAAVMFRDVSGETLQVVTSEEGRIRAGFENGILTLENTEEAKGSDGDDTVILFLPEGTALDRLEISSDSGYFETGNLEAEMLSVTLPDGLWKNNGTITVGTAAFEMNDGYLAAGKLKASKALTISVKDGVISGDRLDSPEISIECHDGLVRGTLAGTQEEYGWQASVGDGILEIGDQRSWNSLEKDQGERRLELSVNDGAAKIEFEG